MQNNEKYMLVIIKKIYGFKDKTNKLKVIWVKITFIG